MMDLKPAVQYMRAALHPHTAGTPEEMRRLLHGELGRTTLVGCGVIGVHAIVELSRITGEHPEHVIDRLVMDLRHQVNEP